MSSTTHIVRFKILTVKSPAMRDGQQYTVYYRRGDTRRSTPCYVANKGVVDLSSMPEGAALIHFKHGRGRRYAAKYIQFRVEEYTRGAPRRTVGETEIDCSLACADGGLHGGRVLSVNFRLYGQEASMSVAVLVYPEKMPPPVSFDNLIKPSDRPPASAEEPPQQVKYMGRGEAMALLISLETMLERRRAEEGGGGGKAPSRAEKRLAELEEKRRSMTGTEGMATRAVTVRAEGCVGAQFTALARRTRNNYIGATAAYLRQLALQSGVSLTDDDGGAGGVDEATLREQLSRATRRLDDLGRQLRELEQQQAALGRLQDKMDVTDELCANLDKVAAVQEQVKMLEESRDALNKALRAKTEAEGINNPITREVKEMNDRVKALTAEQEKLRAKVKHMTAIAAGHVLSWARAKNPPEPERPKTNVDDLFDKEDVVPAKSRGNGDGNGNGKNLNDDQRKQILSAFQGLKASAPPATARSVSASSSSGHRTPRDLFGDAPGLPRMGDFTDKPKKEEKPKYQDPLRPAGLGSGMFTAEPANASPARMDGMPSRSEFSFGGGSGGTSNTNRGGSGGGAAAQQNEVFDFNAIMREAGAAGGSNGGGGFSFEPAAPTFTEAPPTKPAISFDSPVSSPHAPQQQQQQPQQPQQPSKYDDPYYDEMDDFTVPPDMDVGGGATVEFADGFTFGVESDRPTPATAPAASATRSSEAASAAPAPRPTFNFGPADDDGAANPFGSGQPTAAFTLEGGPSLNFGPDDTNNAAGGRAGGGGGGGFSNLPTYNFGS